ncbi:MAG TPA: VIT domain-containing protein, partial [Aggregatilineales bacterium]|nr:VIT domain-containing protein [Aggregatilineales bacterium]
MVSKRIFLIAMILMLALVSVAPVFAQDENPRPPMISDGEVYLKTHRVQVDIDNQVATTRIEQVFRNDTDTIAEGTYVFPLPQGATVSDLVMWVDGQPIQAKILNSDEARDVYEEIVRRLRDPALLEYVGQDAIQASVFPIQPHDEIKIEIEYAQILTVENGLVRYIYPLRTDQFSPLPVGDLAVSVHVISNDKIGSVYSPTHRVLVNHDGDYEFRAGYETTNAREGTDFNLYYSLASDEIDANLITYRE